MTISHQEIVKIAHLARIAIQEQAIPNYAHDLSNVLELVAHMNQVDTSSIMPLAHPFEANATLREDVVTEDNVQLQMQKLTEHTANGYYLVPKVIEE